jgi:hypothetical protein
LEVEVGGWVVVGPVPPEPGLELPPLVVVVGIPPPGPVGLPLPVLVGALPPVLVVVVPLPSPAGQEDGLDGPVVVVDAGEVPGVELGVEGGLEDAEVADVAVVDEHCPEYAVTPF